MWKLLKIRATAGARSQDFLFRKREKGLLSTGTALLLLLAPFAAYAESPGKGGYDAVRQCVMENDANYCHSVMTPSSYELFDRYAAYGLMPCLPTDFTYVSEKAAPQQLVVKASRPAGAGKVENIYLVFAQAPEGLRLDLPASLARGLGPNWQNKVQVSEQLYLMMRQNMGGRLGCDQLNGLLAPVQTR